MVKKTLVLYWASYCQYCKPLLPIFQELKEEKHSFNVETREKEEISPSEWEVIRANGLLKSFPTIVVEKKTKKGIMRKKFQGGENDRTKEEFIKFAKKRM